MGVEEFQNARDRFPSLKNLVYLNWAGTGPMPASSVQAVEQLLAALHEYKVDSMMDLMHETDRAARIEIARLINAELSEVAITGTSTTQGIQAAFSAINPLKGQSIVTSDLQYVLTETEMQKWRNRGIEIRVVKNRNGNFEVEDFASAVDSNTCAVFLDSVTWINGYKFDIGEIAKIAHESDAFMVTDSIQHVGHVPLDTKTFGADIIAGSCQKWLSDMLGVGYTFVRKDALEQLERPFYGYTGTEEPTGGWGEYFGNVDRPIFQDFIFRNADASKLEYGGSLNNLAGLAALTPSLRLINGIGIASTFRHIMELKSHLVELINGAGMKLVPPLEDQYQTGITTFQTGLGARADREIVKKIVSGGITVSYRAGAGLEGIRVSTHYVNNTEDLDRFFSSLMNLVAKYR